MRVCVLFTPAPPDASPEELDGLAQRDAVIAALQGLGHQAQALGFAADLAHDMSELRSLAPECAFNLVESVAGRDRLQIVVPALLEELRIPFTGCGLEALALSADKCSAKRRLRAAGLPTPAWAEAGREPAPDIFGRTVIFKSRSQHASVGLDEDSLAHCDGPETLRLGLERRGPGWYAEEFIDGREFNISVLLQGGTPRVLPPAEIDFSPFPAGKPRLVGYRAKWVEDSFEFHNTTRTFEFPPADRPLLAELRRLSLAAWDVFQLRGYARVDFRVDAAGQPWILEVNANPCLSPDAGLAAAAARGGLDYTALIGLILAAAGCG